jgi:hypothetical protein
MLNKSIHLNPPEIEVNVEFSLARWSNVESEDSD